MQQAFGKSLYTVASMTEFLSLPRELRDAIYSALLTSCLPLPTLASAASPMKWIPSNDGGPSLLSYDEAHTFFAYQRSPRTVANFLAANRQINEELSKAIERARRRNALVCKMDCMVLSDGDGIGTARYSKGGCWFTLLSLPLIKNSHVNEEPEEKFGKVKRWAPNVVGRLLSSQQATNEPRRIRSCVETLQIDLRLMGNDASRDTYDGRKISWAVCAALKRVVDMGFDGFGGGEYGYWPMPEIIIDTLILNVVPSQSSMKQSQHTRRAQGIVLASDAPTEGQEAPVSSQDAVANELVCMWNRLWSGEDFKAAYYRLLIERIKRVKVCVDGKVIRERELGIELERGQKERARIALRVGW